MPDGARHPRRRGGAAGPDRGGLGHDGPTPIAGKDPDHHIDEGLDFLEWRIQRHRKRGTGKKYVYTYPAKKALLAITTKVKMICRMSRNRLLAALIHQLNRC